MTESEGWLDLRFIENLQPLTSPSNLVVMPLVWEFFANAVILSDDDIVFFREKKFLFSSKAINEYYGLTPIDSDNNAFSLYMREE